MGSHLLDIWLGAINTAVLLTSSLTMALSVRAAQTNDSRGAARLLGWTILLGSIFLGIKAYEYRHKFEETLVPGKSFSLATAAAHSPQPIPSDINPGHVELFFSFYFALTGLHALHMVIGVSMLAVRR